MVSASSVNSSFCISSECTQFMVCRARQLVLGILCLHAVEDPQTSCNCSVGLISHWQLPLPCSIVRGVEPCLPAEHTCSTWPGVRPTSDWLFNPFQWSQNQGLSIEPCLHHTTPCSCFNGHGYSYIVSIIVRMFLLWEQWWSIHQVEIPKMYLRSLSEEHFKLT